ncbi:ABC transporter substrate-binding protein [Pseudonocardia kunmingensis]|uniref:Peptide/nickel transport system substrate-binding protein n=1 Tax=Pseudonocardia kunmingensis TaxID=630975 RepID=A0A543DPV6_9PSEU|nr:ABC transporter substrate-binding protein [Pseudonocardia kunmingensis]TQM11338.1 peptide/nickel transport system substrate-binding protein [Pseudonocardia kunmingensis]
MRPHWKAGIAALIAAVLLVACGSGGEGSGGSNGVAQGGPADPDATMRVGYGVAPTSLDPHAATSEVVSFRFGLALVYDRLFTITADGLAEGMLVESYSYSDDGLALTMSLRDGVTFRDGTPLDAEAVRVNLERAAAMESPVVSKRLEQVTGVEATGALEVRLTLSEPTPTIPYVLANVAGFIMHPELIANGDPATEANGSGAYSVESWTPGETLTLHRDRTDYWDPDAAKIARFEYSAITDQQAYTNAIIGEQIDVGQFQPQNVAGVEGRDGLVTVMVPQGIGLEMFLNLRSAPLDRVEVRQAINHAYDRAAIVEALYPGSEPKWQHTREGLPGYVPDLQDAFPYDPERARQLLAQAGFPDGIDLGEILVSQSVGPELTAVLQEQLGKSGIRMTPVVVDNLQIFPRYAEGDNAGMLQYTPSIETPASFAVNRFGARHPGGFPDSPEFQQLLAAADDNRLEEGEREQANQALNRFVTEQAWGAPIVWINYPWVLSDRVQNFGAEMDYATTFGPYDFRYLTMAATD